MALVAVLTHAGMLPAGRSHARTTWPHIAGVPSKGCWALHCRCPLRPARALPLPGLGKELKRGTAMSRSMANMDRDDSWTEKELDRMPVRCRQHCWVALAPVAGVLLISYH